MNRFFLNNFRARFFALRSNVFFLIVLCLSLTPLSFGQARVLTGTQFSRLSVVQRARFFEPIISRIAAEEQVDPYLLWTIGYLETRFRPWLVSPAGAEGLMQFMPMTAARFNLANPFQPEPAIRAAARYVRFLSKRFGGRIDSILAGYNAGEGAVDAYLSGKTIRNGKKIINPNGIKTVGGVPPFRETLGYVARGLLVYRLFLTKQLFSGAFVMSVYPSAVSQSVARIRLRDPEIGFNGSILTIFANTNLLNAEPARQNNPMIQIPASLEKNNPTNSINTQTKIEVDTTEEKLIGKSNEVYYEPRTGARYEARNGKIERLAENGEMIVGSRFRLTIVPTIRARGTFFGGKTSSASK